MFHSQQVQQQLYRSHIHSFQSRHLQTISGLWKTAASSLLQPRPLLRCFCLKTLPAVSVLLSTSLSFSSYQHIPDCICLNATGVWTQPIGTAQVNRGQSQPYQGAQKVLHREPLHCKDHYRSSLSGSPSEALIPACSKKTVARKDEVPYREVSAYRHG